MPSNRLVLCRLLLLPSVVLRVRWPKYRSFSFSISPSSEYSGVISFRVDWLDLRVVQETLKSLLQNHSSKALILRRLAFFMVQLSHPYPGVKITSLMVGGVEYSPKHRLLQSDRFHSAEFLTSPKVVWPSVPDPSDLCTLVFNPASVLISAEETEGMPCRRPSSWT